MSETFEKKVCLTAFAESEFGNPFQKGRRPLKKICLTAFAESEFGNPFSFA